MDKIKLFKSYTRAELMAQPMDIQFVCADNHQSIYRRMDGGLGLIETYYGATAWSK